MTMRSDVLLINTVGTGPIATLEADPGLRLSVLTHPEYARFYDPRTPLTEIPDITDLNAVRDAAVRLLRTGTAFDRVIAPSERSLQPAGYLRSFLGLPGPGYEVMNRFSNKYTMKRALRAAGLPVAPFAPLGSLTDLPDIANRLGWPLVVKPVIGAAARNTHVVADPAAYRELLDSPHAAALHACRYPLLAERFVEVTAELRCDAVVSDGSVRFASVSRYVVPPLARRGRIAGSYTLAGGSRDLDPVRELNDAVIAALGLREGVTHLEVLRTPEGDLVGEISARPGGGGIDEVIRLRYGVDLWQEFVNVSVGREPDCAVTDSGGVVIGCMLPAAPGRVEEVTPPAELATVPGVVGVDLHLAPGDVVTDEWNSSVCAGLLYLRAPDEAAVPGLLAGVERAFTLTTRPVVTAP